MFKMLPPKVVILVVAWTTATVLWVGIEFEEVLPGFVSRVSFLVFIVSLLFALIMGTNVWRWIWKKVPKLDQWIYPDLNGEWEVEIESNWPRIDTLIRAAKGEIAPITNWREDDSHLPPLTSYRMRARITQSWLEMNIRLWNPSGDTPIKESKTLLIQPFRSKDGCHGLAYIFEQSNETDALTDDTRFQGAASLTRDPDDRNVLRGRMWTDRMWRRGMNTAANVTFTRQPM